MNVTITGYIVNFLRLDAAALSTFNGYYIYRTVEEAREEAREMVCDGDESVEVWRVTYKFDAALDEEDAAFFDENGYGPAGDENGIPYEDWFYRSAVIEQLAATASHKCELVG